MHRATSCASPWRWARSSSHAQDASEAQARARDEVFDHIAPLLQKSPYRIPSRDMNDKIRYRFEKRDSRFRATRWNSRSAQASAPGTKTQPSGCRSARAVRSMPRSSSADDRRRALEPTQWLESADPQMVRLAKRVGGETARPRPQDAPAHRLRARPHGQAVRHAGLWHGTRGAAFPARRLHRVRRAAGRARAARPACRRV